MLEPLWTEGEKKITAGVMKLRSELGKYGATGAIVSDANYLPLDHYLLKPGHLLS